MSSYLPKTADTVWASYNKVNFLQITKKKSPQNLPVRVKYEYKGQKSFLHPVTQ